MKTANVSYHDYMYTKTETTTSHYDKISRFDKIISIRTTT